MDQVKGSVDLSQRSGRGNRSLGSESSGPGDHWGLQDDGGRGAENEPEEEMVCHTGKEHTVGAITDTLELQSSRPVVLPFGHIR